MRSEIAETMIHARLQAGLTQSELAKLMRTTQSSIARIEAGRYKPTLSTLEKLAEVTGMRLEVKLI